jgi:hypothetical protein
MVGTDGPGDKLFRLIPDPSSNAPSMNDPTLDQHQLGRSALHGSADPAEMFWAADTNVMYSRFRSFPRDEGSQLDKVSGLMKACSTSLFLNNANHVANIIAYRVTRDLCI